MKQEKFICEKCGKEYTREDFYLKHITKCGETIEEFLEEIEEGVGDVEWLDDDVISEIEKHERRNKGEIIMDIIKLTDALPHIPKDIHTRNICIDLYNEFHKVDIRKGCKDCQFDQIYSSLQVLARRYKK